MDHGVYVEKEELEALFERDSSFESRGLTSAISRIVSFFQDIFKIRQ